MNDLNDYSSVMNRTLVAGSRRNGASQTARLQGVVSESFTESSGPPGTAPSLRMTPTPPDLVRIERAVREILLAVGEDPTRDGLRETPRRVARAYRDLFAGLNDDAGRHLERTFEHESDQLVVVGNIDFSSTCEHHLLPFFGKAHIAYLPGHGRVVGLSKLARTVDVFARRPQLQERLTEQVAEALDEHLSPRGVCVVMEAEHLCMRVRGANKPRAITTTMAVRGLYRTDPAARTEALSLMKRGYEV